MKAIIIDTETNGKIKNFKLKLTKQNLQFQPAVTLDNFPRVTQIAWQLVSLETGEVLNEYQSLIKPDGWTVPTEQFFIDNNMSTERCEREGVPCMEALEVLKQDMNQSDLLVAHNMDFDIPVIQAEMLRYKVKYIKQLVKVCTMKESVEHCKIPSAYGGYKWPKLEELYKVLFDKDMKGAHDAFADVSACRECFIQLVKLGVITV